MATAYTAGGQRVIRYLSGAEAIKEGIINEDQWNLAWTHPWTWVVLSTGQRIRSIPWQGLELRTDKDE